MLSATSRSIMNHIPTEQASTYLIKNVDSTQNNNYFYYFICTGLTLCDTKG